MMTADYVKNEDEKYERIHLFRLIIGIILCVICWIPAAFLDELSKVEDLGGVFLFMIVGIGVFMIVYTNIIKSAYENLLKINDVNTISGSYGKRDDEIEYIQVVTGQKISIMVLTVSLLYSISSSLFP